MDKKELRELANAHWNYTRGIIEIMLKLCKFLYVESMIHGYKHKVDENE